MRMISQHTTGSYSPIDSAGGPRALFRQPQHKLLHVSPNQAQHLAVSDAGPTTWPYSERQFHPLDRFRQVMARHSRAIPRKCL